MHLIILVKQLGLYHFLFVFKSSFKKKRKGKVGSCRSGTYFAPLLCGLNLLGKRAFNNYYTDKKKKKKRDIFLGYYHTLIVLDIIYQIGL